MSSHSDDCTDVRSQGERLRATKLLLTIMARTSFQRQGQALVTPSRVERRCRILGLKAALYARRHKPSGSANPTSTACPCSPSDGAFRPPSFAALPSATAGRRAPVRFTKHDGFRILARRQCDRVRLFNRNGYDFIARSLDGMRIGRKGERIPDRSSATSGMRRSHIWR